MKSREQITERYNWLGAEIERLVTAPAADETAEIIEDKLNEYGPEMKVLEWVIEGEWSDNDETTQIAVQTAKNLELIGAFVDHLRDHEEINVPEHSMLSFFDA